MHVGLNGLLFGSAAGFLSWNTLGGRLKENVAAGTDPFAL